MRRFPGTLAIPQRGKVCGVRSCANVFAAIVSITASVPAEAQTYPARSIRLVVPFAPGGALDVVGRITGSRLSDALGVPVVVDNRGGAGGTIGANIVAQAPPDGHTLLIGSLGLAVNAVLYPKLPYDTLKDLAPVTMLGEQPNIIVVHPSVPVSSVKELIALARAKPGQVRYASGGIGSTSHLVTVLFLMMAKVDMTHVPYKGLGPAISDLLGGHVDLAISNVSTAVAHVKANKLRLLAVTSDKRFPLFPQTPTVAEAGVPGAESSGWYGLLATAGTPAFIIARLNEEMKTILTSAGLKEQFATLGLEPIPTSPEEFAKLLRSDIDKWAKVIKASGIKPGG